MKKLIAGTAVVLAIAAAVPLVASAHGEGDGRSMDCSMDYGQHGARHGMHDQHGDGHAGHGGKIRLMQMIESYDANGDGSVSQDEIDQFRADRLHKFDTNGDGKLSLDEYQALWLDAMRERMVDQFQAHDDDGDGLVTVEEFDDRTSHLVMMRDRNGDGVLNMDDLRRGPHGANAAPAQHEAPAEQGEAQPQQ